MSELPEIVQAQSRQVQRAFILWAAGTGICEAAREVGLSEEHVCRVKSRDNWDQLVQAQINREAETVIDSFADEALGARRRALGQARDMGDLLGLLTDELAERDDSGRLVRLKPVVLGVDKAGNVIEGPIDSRALNSLASALNSNFRTQHVASGEAHREKQELAKEKGSGPAVVVISPGSVPSIREAKAAGVFQAPPIELPAAPAANSPVPELVAGSDPLS